MAELALEMRNITKTFPGVQALDHVSFSCRVGEIHALVGENGAGKSTLMKILAGALQPDPESGEITLKGKRVDLTSPAEAQRLGVSIIYQEFNLLPWLSVAENILLGRLPRNAFGVVNWKRVYAEAQKPLDALGLSLDLRAPVIDLSVAQQQIVEIAKALSLQSDLMIMDEPSAVLAGHELERLFELIRMLRSHGVTVIYISHRLDEVFEIADRATVLKDGQVMGTLDVRETDSTTLIRMMVGRTLDETFPTVANGKGEPALAVKNLSCSRLGLKDISFTLNRGEILGLAGLVGAGRSEMARALFGIEPIDSGEIWVNGKRAHIRNPQDAVGLGIGFVPEDRKTQGLVLSLSTRQNLTLSILDRLTNLGLLDERRERQVVQKAISDLAIKTPSPEQEVQYLSGGNQQKVVLAKWLTANPQVIILDEPTRGIDVGTKVEMYHLMRELARRGTGVIMISSELPEILGMSDRILVMSRGRIMGELNHAEATEERILKLAIGEGVQPQAQTAQAEGSRP